MKTYEGATVIYYWTDDEVKQQHHSYISFGDYVEHLEEDSFGVPDNAILYYTRGEKDLKDLMVEGAADFVIVSYELLGESDD